MLIAKGLLGGLFQVALFAVFLLVPAGTWDWPRAIQFLIGLALWLESYAGVLAVSVVFASLVARIHAEEKTLRDTLPGYTEYMNKVRYRLVPGIW